MKQPSTTVRVADVALEARTGGAQALYTYRDERGAAVGEAYQVPLGTRQAIGYVVAIAERTPEDLGFEPKHLRPLGPRVEGLALPERLVSLIRFVAESTLSPFSVALSPATPPGANKRVVSSWSLLPGTSAELAPAEREALRVLQDQGGILVETPGKPLLPGPRKTLQRLVAKGLVERTMTLALSVERHRLTGNLRLTSDSARIEKFLLSEGKRRPAQALTLMRLQGAESALFTPQEIKALAGVTDQTLRALVQAGLLEEASEEDRAQRKSHTLSPAQARAASALREAVMAREARTFLLYGVTGSGKTEVYLQAAEEALRQNRRVLYLVPEIALTAQVIAQLRDRFGSGVAILHSALPAGERLQTWARVHAGEAPVILGPRSALFAPIDDLGLIVMDEEHESSYKQDSAPRYVSKRVAIELARLHGAPLVLGSATPSIETFWEAKHGDIQLLELPARVAGAELPKVQSVNLSHLYRKGKPSLFSPQLHRAIDARLTGGEQVILFLNRRAFAPFIVCRDCGARFLCPHCSVSLSFHREADLLRCHQCDYATRAPKTCPTCQSGRLGAFGAGVERVEEAVRAEFPSATVARLDRDVARRRGALEETLAAFRSGSAQILVGTQMVAKGLDFPNVTLVGVIEADVSLNLPDFRASERAFQLLTQVAGRAGRGQRAGEVIIQTLDPEHVSVRCAIDHDYLALYEGVIVEREEAGYPPFVRLVNVLMASPSRPEVKKLSQDVKERLEAELTEAQVVGPADCAIERIQGQWRRHVLIKLVRDASPVPVRTALERLSLGNVSLTIDVDPSNLM